MTARILREVRGARRARPPPRPARAARRRSARASSCPRRSARSSATTSPRRTSSDASSSTTRLTVGERDAPQSRTRVRARAAGRAAVLGEPRDRLVARCVEHDPAVVHEERRGRRARADVPAAAPRRRPRTADCSTMLEERIGRVGIELRRRLVEQQQLRPQRERRRERDALQLAARQLGRLPPARCSTPTSASASSTRGQISAGSVPRFSSPNATSFATRLITIWSSGSWKTDATVPASSAGRVSRVSRPATTTRPENVPP